VVDAALMTTEIKEPCLYTVYVFVAFKNAILICIVHVYTVNTNVALIRQWINFMVW